MPTIIVTRGAGDKEGQDIVDSLLSTIPAQLSRGAAELDAHSTTPQAVDLTTVYRAGVVPGQLVEIHDAMQGVSYKAKVSGVSHRIDGGSVVSNLNVVRPLEVL